jgi:sugar phosphate permease
VSRYRWVILGAGTLAQSSYSAASVGLPALAPLLQSHYRLSLGLVGIALGAVSFGALPTLLLWGFLADRIGERAVVAIGLGSAGGAMLAVPLTKSFAALVGLLALYGGFGASINAASGRAVMGWFHERQRGVALGVRQGAVPIGGATAAAGLPWLARGGDLQPAFLALGTATLATAAVAAILMREAPAAPAALDVAGTGRPIRDVSSWLLAFGSSLFGIAQIALTTYPVLFLHQHRGLSTHDAALTLAAVNVLGIGVRIGAGRWSDHLRSRVKPLRILGLVISAGMAAVAALTDAPLAVLLPVLIAAGVMSLSWNGLAFTAAAESAGAGRSGVALGFQQTVLGITFAVATPVFAALVGATSWRIAFAAAAVVPLAGVLALRRLPAVTGGARSRETSVIPPAIP